MSWNPCNPAAEQGCCTFAKNYKGEETKAIFSPQTPSKDACLMDTKHKYVRHKLCAACSSTARPLPHKSPHGLKVAHSYYIKASA